VACFIHLLRRVLAARFVASVFEFGFGLLVVSVFEKYDVLSFDEIVVCSVSSG
jgi:hypothetical protein